MTKEELATLLHGNEYRNEISDELNQKAKESGLLVIYGASDDLCYLGGVGNDEIGCWGGGYLILSIKPKDFMEGGEPEIEGYLFDELEDVENIDARIRFLTDYKNGNVVTINWCEVNGYPWTYETDLPHSTFDIMEDGETYCRGIVIDLKDLN